jgi:hypothetical protein
VSGHNRPSLPISSVAAPSSLPPARVGPSQESRWSPHRHPFVGMSRSAGEPHPPPSPCLSDASLLDPPCLSSVSHLWEAVGEDRHRVRSLLAHHCSCCVACAAPERAPMSLWPRSFVVPWASLVTGRADLFHHRPSQAAGFTSASWPLHGFGPIAYDLFKILFFFQIQFYSSLNFRNSYLFEYCSKIHGTNSVRFLNSCSTHEKYKT